MQINLALFKQETREAMLNSLELHIFTKTTFDDRHIKQRKLDLWSWSADTFMIWFDKILLKNFMLLKKRCVNVLCRMKKMFLNSAKLKVTLMKYIIDKIICSLILCFVHFSDTGNQIEHEYLSSFTWTSWILLCSL